jgi:hypothetical protein
MDDSGLGAVTVMLTAHYQQFSPGMVVRLPTSTERALMIQRLAVASADRPAFNYLTDPAFAGVIEPPEEPGLGGHT